MNKRIIISLITFMALIQSVSADDFSFLTITKTDNWEQSFALGTFKSITFDNGNMVVKTASGEQSFALSELSKLQFTTEATGISLPENDASTGNAAQIYTLSGIKVNKGIKNLTPGAYIVKTGNRTKKVLIP
jgi:hypothetical protein